MRDERGQSLSAFVAVVMTALFLVAGLVVDGARQSEAQRVAQVAASDAARAASDAAATARLAGRPVDVGAAVAAAQQRLSAAGVSGTVSVPAVGTVRVEVSSTATTVFLSLLGIDHLDAHASAEAALFAR